MSFKERSTNQINIWNALIKIHYELIVNICHKNLNIYLFNLNTFSSWFLYWWAFVNVNHFCQCQSLTKVSCNNVFSLSFIPRQTENKEEIRDFSSISYRPSQQFSLTVKRPQPAFFVDCLQNWSFNWSITIKNMLIKVGAYIVWNISYFSYYVSLLKK